jgi:hypothetical protein
MSVRVPNGSIISIASGYVAAKTITAITNAATAVASATAHGFVTGDFVEITSGWSRLNGKIVRVLAAPTADTFSIEGIDTTSTTIYPVGGSVGSARKISGWTQLSQILSSNSAGGDQQFLTYQFLESDAQKQIPTFKNPQSLTISVADDSTQAGYQLASTANDDRLPRAVRVVLPDASQILYNAYISLNKTPSLTVNELMACQVTLSLLAEVVRY